MSFVTLKNEFNEDLLACRACLATDRKLYSVYQDDLVKAYKNLMGCGVSPYDTLPQYICSCCSVLLLKYNMFRDLCRRAINYLEDARIFNTNITPEYLNNFKPQKQYKKSKTEHMNINSTENITDCKTDDTDDCYDRHNPSPDTENCNIYTHTVEIKQEIHLIDIDTEIPNKKQINEQKCIENTKIVKKKGKYFETKENMSDFEKDFNVQVIVLSQAQQIKDVLERKLSLNYIHSPYKCELCFKGYMAADILKKHMVAQHDESRGDVVCEYCKFRYKDRRGLNHHLKTHRLKFICKQCSYVSRTTFNAKEHFKVHGGQVHQCSHCGKSHEKLSSHLSHLRIQHPSAFIWCNICGEAFIGAFGLNSHKKKAHRHFPLPAACPSCDKRFVDNKALDRHSSLDFCSEHTCVHCGEGFTEALPLRDHLLEKHKSNKVYNCEKCDKKFSRENLYSAHYRRVHVESQDKPFRKIDKPWICEVCGKTLPNKCLLLYHQRNHTGEKPYRCPQCPKGFTMRKLLQSHLRVHTNERPYVCKLCPKTFKGLSALRGHEYIHTGQTKLKTKNRIIE